MVSGPFQPPHLTGRIFSLSWKVLGIKGKILFSSLNSDHSSHTAALVVRKVCKKHKKPFQMLLNSSLNNILSTLLAVRNNLAPIQNGEDDFQGNLS